MKLLMLSWRSPGHPQAGGAEALTHEILRRAVQRGHEITWFSAMWPGAAASEEIDGIRIVRAGRQWSVHVRAWRWLRRRPQAFDLVVDQVNTIPFFTPLYVPEARRRMFIFQTAREYWWQQTRGLFRLIAPIGYVAEPWYLKAYRGTRAITISESTRGELLELGVPSRNVAVIPMANPFPSLPRLEPKPAGFRVVVIGRLEPAKHVEEALEGFAVLQRQVPEAALDVVGRGHDAYRQQLEARVQRLGLRHVVFHGRVDEDAKQELLQRAHVHVFCSHREGWGLTVTEAAGMGTPSVGYDAPGVRDSIGEARLLVRRGDPSAIGARLLALHADAAQYEALRQSAWERTRTMSYEATTDAFLEALDA